jgi:hypothetical protein
MLATLPFPCGSWLLQNQTLHHKPSSQGLENIFVAKEVKSLASQRGVFIGNVARESNKTKVWIRQQL